MAKQALGPWQEAWLQTLESGIFKQCRSSLCEVEVDDNGTMIHSFCCLGIWEEVLIENLFDIKGKYISDDKGPYAYVYDGNCSIPPQDHTEILGLYSDHGRFCMPPIDDPQFNRVQERLEKMLSDAPYTCRSLVDLNDEGCTFKKIAAFCRRFPEVVFKESK